jgi:hypothetical protein
MRKLSVLTSLAVLALLTAPVVNAATLLAVDPPDVNIGPGTTASDTFNLDDFFNSTAGTVGYTATGASVNGSLATVDGLANVGTTSAAFTGTNGTDTLTVNSSVFVSAFNIGNAPDINNNNRLSGIAPGNQFANLISAGGSFSSSLPLSNLPQGGGGGGAGSPGGVTGGGVSGGAALIATIASVGLNTDPVSGLRERTVNGDIAAWTNGQLTIDFTADGNYTVTAGDSVAGNHIVTLGASAAGGTDAVHLLAAAATDVPLTNFGGGTVTVAPGETNLMFDPAVSIPVNGGAATVVLNYNLSSKAGATLAVIGFDGAVAFQAVSFSNSGEANLQAGTNKNLATSFTVNSGSVIPAVQLNNAGSAPITLTINSIKVASAGPLTDFALNPNATVVTSDFGGRLPDGIINDILGSGADPAAFDAGNNFASALGEGSMKLAGAAGTSNASIIFAAPQGEVAAEAYVQRVGAASADSALAMVITDGGATSISGFKPGGSIPETGWTKVTVSGTITGGSPQAFLVIQAAGFNANIDDVSVRVITDKPEHFDADLLG